MANEIRVRGNLTSGTLSSTLTNVATSMSSAGLANLPVVGATQHAVITIESEIVYVTAHTGGATTATILRAQDGTSAAAHGTVAWVHGPVASDFVGALGRASATANQGSITTEVDLTSLTTTVTVPYAGHVVKITGKANFQSTVADDRIDLRIYQDGVMVNDADTALRVANSDQTCFAQALVVPTAASHTYKLTAVRLTGTGTITMSCGATFPAFILVQDLGPAL